MTTPACLIVKGYLIASSTDFAAVGVRALEEAGLIAPGRAAEILDPEA